MAIRALFWSFFWNSLLKLLVNLKPKAWYMRVFGSNCAKNGVEKWCKPCTDVESCLRRNRKVECHFTRCYKYRIRWSQSRWLLGVESFNLKLRRDLAIVRPPTMAVDQNIKFTTCQIVGHIARFTAPIIVRHRLYMAESRLLFQSISSISECECWFHPLIRFRSVAAAFVGNRAMLTCCTCALRIRLVARRPAENKSVPPKNRPPTIKLNPANYSWKGGQTIF